jgi:ornithine cyclodeaminase
VFAGNRARNLPTINALVVAVDPATGVPLGVLEGATVTALRTGAVSGAATDLLAALDASVLAVIGAGVQGVTQAAAVCSVRNISEIRVVDVSIAAAASFAERLAVWSPDAARSVAIAASAQEALRGADVVCTATTATSPVFDDTWVSEGAHINAIGAFTPRMCEVPPETLARAVIVVDDVEAVMHEAGDLIQALERGAIQKDAISTELGQIVAGDRPGRRSPEQVTFFKSVGNAIQDMIVAGVALEQAETRGLLGQHLTLD